jgi:hypothetical protein
MKYLVIDGDSGTICSTNRMSISSILVYTSKYCIPKSLPRRDGHSASKLREGIDGPGRPFWRELHGRMQFHAERFAIDKSGGDGRSAFPKMSLRSPTTQLRIVRNARSCAIATSHRVARPSCCTCAHAMLAKPRF